MGVWVATISMLNFLSSGEGGKPGKQFGFLGFLVFTVFTPKKTNLCQGPEEVRFHLVPAP